MAAVVLIILTVLVGILFNRQDIRDLRNELGRKVDDLARTQHNDMLTVMGLLRELDVRITRLEESR